MVEQTIKKTREQIEEKRSQLESALLDFPDEWDMIEELADSFITWMHYRPEPELRKLAPGEEMSMLEKQGFADAKIEWSKGHKPLKERYLKALQQIRKYKLAKQELTKFGKK